MKLVEYYHGVIGGFYSGMPQCWGQFEIIGRKEDVCGEIAIVRCTRCGHKTSYYASILKPSRKRKPCRLKKDSLDIVWA